METSRERTDRLERSTEVASDVLFQILLFFIYYLCGHWQVFATKSHLIRNNIVFLGVLQGLGKANMSMDMQVIGYLTLKGLRMLMLKGLISSITTCSAI